MKKLVLAALLTLIVGLAYLPLGQNLWSLLTARGYLIPTSSSVFTFEPTRMNQGSGEWWLYGEDGAFYYHFTGLEENPVMKISRENASRCSGFDAQNVASWCGTN